MQLNFTNYYRDLKKKEKKDKEKSGFFGKKKKKAPKAEPVPEEFKDHLKNIGIDVQQEGTVATLFQFSQISQTSEFQGIFVFRSVTHSCLKSLPQNLKKEK